MDFSKRHFAKRRHFARETYGGDKKSILDHYTQFRSGDEKILRVEKLNKRKFVDGREEVRVSWVSFISFVRRATSRLN